MSRPSVLCLPGLLHLSSWATVLEKGHFPYFISSPKNPPLCSPPPGSSTFPRGRSILLLASWLLPSTFPVHVLPAPVPSEGPSNLQGSSSSVHDAPGELRGAATPQNPRLVFRQLKGSSASQMGSWHEDLKRGCTVTVDPRKFCSDLGSVGIFGCREPHGGTEPWDGVQEVRGAGGAGCPRCTFGSQLACAGNAAPLGI